MVQHADIDHTGIPGVGSGGGAVAVLEETVVTGSVAATIDLTTIDGGYRHLLLIIQGRSDTSADFAIINVTFNADSSAIYDWHRSTLTNATLAHSAQTAQTSMRGGIITAATAGSNRPGHSIIHIPNYAATVFQKTASVESSALVDTPVADFNSEMARGLWRSTAAITRITLTPSAGNWIVGSTATLYGMDTL